MELTNKQKSAFKYIRDEIEERRAPSYSEITEFLKSNSISSAQSMVRRLAEKGLIKPPDDGIARTIELTKAGRDYGRKESFDLEGESWPVALLGSVPAGPPLEAIGEQIGVVHFSPSLLPRPRPKQKQLFALRAEGDSMLYAGILNGDVMVARAQPEAIPGEIVIARFDDGEATVKTLGNHSKRGWYLKPENPDPSYKEYYAQDRNFNVVGKVVGMLRTIGARTPRIPFQITQGAD